MQQLLGSVPAWAVLIAGVLVVSQATADSPHKDFRPVPAKGGVTFVPTDDENDVPKPFRLAKHGFDFETEFERDSDGVRVHKLRFPSPVTTDVPVNNTVHAQYFQPPGQGPFPGVVVLHILGGDFALSQTIANGLARKGVATLFVKMPYYGERRDRRSPRRMVSPDLDQTVAGMTQAVLDVRRAAAWLGERPEVDPQRLGITGISMGGIMTSIAGAAEPRFENVAVYLAGGGLNAAIWDHPEPRLRELRQKWEAEGLTRETFLAKTAVVDPLTYASRLSDRRVLIVAAEHDEVIPPACTVALHKMIGEQAELVWLDAGHFTAALYLYGEMERLGRFFTTDVVLAE